MEFCGFSLFSFHGQSNKMSNANVRDFGICLQNSKQKGSRFNKTNTDARNPNLYHRFATTKNNVPILFSVREREATKGLPARDNT
jgi:hypothetical protein